MWFTRGGVYTGREEGSDLEWKRWFRQEVRGVWFRQEDGSGFRNGRGEWFRQGEVRESGLDWKRVVYTGREEGWGLGRPR